MSDIHFHSDTTAICLPHWRAIGDGLYIGWYPWWTLSAQRGEWKR